MKMGMKYGLAPDFRRIAAMAEPRDAITVEDLHAVHKCAEGGDYASMNQQAADGLLNCIVDSARSFADEVQTNLTDAWQHGTRPRIRAKPQAMAPEKGQMKEGLFYIKDLRCIEPCPGIRDVIA